MIKAFCFLLARQRDADSHRQISIARMAQSEDKAVKSQLEQWEDEGS